MTRCRQCGEQVDDAGEFCPHCGGPMSKGRPSALTAAEDGVLRRFERQVFFRIARGFSWVVALLAAIGFGFAVALIIPNAAKLLGGDTEVRADDIRAAIDAAKRGRSYDAGQTEGGRIEPKLRAKLDEAMYEIVALMPANLQRESNIEDMRRSLRRGVAPLDTIEEKVGALRELAQLLKQFPEGERLDSLEVYFEVKIEKERKVREEKLAAGAAVAKNAYFLISAVITITLVSMILVLLSVERNTRKET